MTNKTQNGGPAFPIQNGDTGMSLRDYFAAKAIAGWLASFGDDVTHPADSADSHCAETIARMSYRMADAMLKARSETP